MIQNSKAFNTLIERIVIQKRVSYLDAILYYCEKNGVEVEVAAKLINSKIKTIIATEASDLNLLKTKINQLPI
jgi:hypothetical protein